MTATYCSSRKRSAAPYLAILIAAAGIALGAASSAAENLVRVHQEFGCQLRYFFRDSLTAEEPGKKRRSAADFKFENFPGPQRSDGVGKSGWIVRGRALYIPISINIHLIDEKTDEGGTLRINVVSEKNGKSLRGFPKHLKGARKRLQTGVGIDIAVSGGDMEKVESALLPQGRSLTHITLVIGSDIPTSSDKQR